MQSRAKTGDVQLPFSNRPDIGSGRLDYRLPQWEDRSTFNRSLVEPNHFVECVPKQFKTRRGDDDGVAATTIDLFGDPQERSLQILFQIKAEMLSFNPNMGIA